MNKFEKFFYDSTKSKPWLKFLIRNIYQSLFDLLPRKKEYSINNFLFRQNYFFGFHDKTPFSANCRKVLANHLIIESLRMPKPDDGLEIGYFKFDSLKIDDYVNIDKSFAWNYHKGCRLQWINNDSIIFNSAQNGKLISKIINTNSLKEKIIDYPIDSVSENGKWATSFSYERLQYLMPGYGYGYSDNGFLKENSPKETGIFLVNLEDNSCRLLLSLHDLVSGIRNIPEIHNYKHYVTHSAFSYDGRYVSFLHRWIGLDIRDRKTRLIIFDLDNISYSVAPTDGMVSHYVWNKKNQLIVYCNVDKVDCHTLFDVVDLNNYLKVAPDQLNSDGHQSFISDTEFITDTYPDKFRLAKLYRVNIINSHVQLLASFYSPKKYQTRNFQKHIACDLHPRVSPNGKYLSFDCIRNDKRSFCIMQLPT